ncbi:MAG: hypothetical protein ACXAC2_11895 [Candidatus Kariarchaeaceae archaeon]|jgi:hypothetical protein
MQYELFLSGSLAIFTFLIILYILERFLNVGSQVQQNRKSNLYQGGEIINAKDRRYATTIFFYVLFFLILHVIGFLWATTFSLNLMNEDMLNSTTLGFGVLTSYIILMIRATKEIVTS